MRWVAAIDVRKSIMVGTQLLKCWSSTQAGVAMSSGEAEFYGAVKGATRIKPATTIVDRQLGGSRDLQHAETWQVATP